MREDGWWGGHGWGRFPRLPPSRKTNPQRLLRQGFAPLRAASGSGMSDNCIYRTRESLDAYRSLVGKGIDAIVDNLRDFGLKVSSLP